MSEEIRDASRTLPRAIVYSCAFNGLLGLIMAITLCFVIGDVDIVLATPTGFVFIQLFYNTTGSLLATNAMCAFVIIVAFFAVITIMASASRQCFAFARDDGLPCSKWLREVKEGWDLPINAIYLSLGVAVLLSLIVVGSAAAFNSLTSLGAVALLSSYIFCVGCFLWNRLSGQVRLPSEFDLGRWSALVSAMAVAGLLVMFVFAFFPPAPKPMLEAVNMNWSCLIFGLACVWGGGYYVLVARKVSDDERGKHCASS